VSVVGLVRLTRAVLPHRVNAGHGGIINVSSLMAFDDRLGWTVYLATKAFVTRITENLGLELASSDVAVQALCAGPVAGTKFFERAGFDTSVFRDAVVMTAPGRGGSLAGRVG
jgi:short-subunit dehydrogenase